MFDTRLKSLSINRLSRLTQLHNCLNTFYWLGKLLNFLSFADIFVVSESRIILMRNSIYSPWRRKISGVKKR